MVKYLQRPLRNASVFLYKTRGYTFFRALLEKPFDNLHFLQNISQKTTMFMGVSVGNYINDAQCDVCLHALCVSSGTTSLGGRDGLISHCFQHCDVTSECENWACYTRVHTQPGIPSLQYTGI